MNTAFLAVITHGDEALASSSRSSREPSDAVSRPTRTQIWPHVTQPSVSELERGVLDRAGLATIKAYVEALGGSVEVVAEFGGHRVVIG
ncbi:MAG: hypothetical protein GC157_16025 [Frankiales bacterium]|nr:hypothetical protein [Frankiales bacterium]